MTCPCGFRGCPGLKAEIVRTGRWSWQLNITDGPSVIGDPMWGPPRAFGSRAHAERKARKIMAKQLNWKLRERFNLAPIIPPESPSTLHQYDGRDDA